MVKDKHLLNKMSESKRSNLNAMDDDPSYSESDTSSDDDGPHPDAYTGNEVRYIQHTYIHIPVIHYIY